MGVTESGGRGLVQGVDGVVSFDGQQGEVVAQHGPGLGVGEVMAQPGGGGVDAGHDIRAGVLFGGGAQRIGIHVGGQVKPVEGVGVGGGDAVGRVLSRRGPGW